MDERQTTILVAVNINNQADFEESVEELSNLAEACDLEVIGTVTQSLKTESTSHYIGKGKIEEVKTYVNATDADMVVFNDELSSTQIRNLEAEMKCEIIDRTVLILNIFAERAKTKEAKLQVDIAKLRYMLPRLTGYGIALSRQGGGGFINRGSGETKLELDRRKIESRISALDSELQTLVAQRQNMRKRRKKNEIPTVALVGYTNAGKSTIMNAMLDLYNPSDEKKVLEKDMLFATLETSVRRIDLEDKKAFLLTDTVGFIGKLPHQLIKAFRSTLEEVTEADLLIHVVDYSNPNYKQQIQVTNETLSSLGADKVPVLYAYNKADLQTLDVPKDLEDIIYMSAKNKADIDRLASAIKRMAFPKYISCEMLIPYDKGGIVSYFNENANVKSTEYKNDGVLVSMECKEDDFHRYKEYSN